MSYEDYEEEPFVIIEKHSGGAGGFLAGVAIGAGLALLLAPQSGRKTRQDIERRAKEARERAEHLANDVGDRVSDQIHRARTQVEAQLDSARSQIDFRKQQVQSAVEAGRAAARDARGELERRIADTKAAYQAGVEVGRERAEPQEDAVSPSVEQGRTSSTASARPPRRSARGVSDASGA